MSPDGADQLDFPVRRTVQADSPEELRAAFAEHEAVRLAGTGTAQLRLPPPDREVTVVSTRGMDRILRLEADDLTCSVEPGVRREHLDQELGERGLWLPCPGGGTIGGLFAADEHGPAGPAQPEPRSLLLGVTGMLAEGRRFRSGARVVKNVAGFDLQKLFVGSRGRLFAVTELHLKLRPRPRSVLHFANPGLEPGPALELAGRLRRLPTRPAALVFVSEANGGCAVRGTLAGEAGFLDRLAAQLGLRPVDTGPEPPVETADAEGAVGLETVRGQVRFRRLGELLARLPEGVRSWHAGERFAVRLPEAASDALLGQLPELGGVGEVTAGRPERRGKTTPGDPESARLSREIATALDPAGLLR